MSRSHLVPTLIALASLFGACSPEEGAPGSDGGGVDDASSAPADGGELADAAAIDAAAVDATTGDAGTEDAGTEDAGGAGTGGVTHWGAYVDVATPEPTLVFDSFESALFDNPAGPLPARNTIGFDWPGAENRAVSIARTDDYIVANNRGAIEPPAGPFPAKEIEAAPGSEGQHSARFRYAADREMTEFGFNWTDYRTEVWISYWMRVPINYTHGSLNNKFFSIYPTRSTYDEPGTLTIQTRPNGSGGANLLYQDGGVTSGETGSVPFISVPSDRGRWMHIVMRVERASSSTANDGAYQLWRRWQDEGAYTLLHSKLDAQLYNSTDPNGFRAGYIMGWANDPYAMDTEWFMDDFAVSDQPLVPAGTEGLE